MRQSRETPSRRETPKHSPRASKTRKRALALEKLESRDLLANTFMQGLVFHDLNGNSVYDTNEPLQAGATVRLFRGTETTPLRSAMTGADGYYFFGDLPPGNYRLEQTGPTGFYSSGAHFLTDAGTGLPQLDTPSIPAGTTNRIDVQLLDPDTLSVDYLYNPSNYRHLYRGVTLRGAIPQAFDLPGTQEAPVGQISLRVFQNDQLFRPMNTYCVDIEGRPGQPPLEFPEGAFQAEVIRGPIGYLFNRYGTRTTLTLDQKAGLQLAIWEFLYDVAEGRPANLRAGTFQYILPPTQFPAVEAIANNFIQEAQSKSEPALFLRMDDPEPGRPFTQSFLGLRSYNFSNRPAGNAGGLITYRQPDCTNIPQERGPQAGVTVYLDLNNNQQLDPNEPRTLTDANGRYTFSNLRPGTYTARQVVSGWTQLSAPAPFTVLSGQTITGLNFRNDLPIDPNLACGSLAGRITHQQPNCDAMQNLGGRRNVTVYLDANNNGRLDPGERSTVTDGNGNFRFTTTAAGTHRVRVVLPSGATFVGDSGRDYQQATPFLNVTDANFHLQFPIDQNLACGSLAGRITYQQPNCDAMQNLGGRRNVTVYLDANNNGRLDPGERSTVTDVNGNFRIAPTGAGTHRVRVVLPSGATFVGTSARDYQQTGPLFGATDANFVLQFPPDSPLNCIPRVQEVPRPVLLTHPGVSPPVLVADLGGKLQLLGSTIGQDPQGQGLLANAAFVTGLYRNLLNRMPDDTGLVAWVQALQTGASRSQVVAAIYNSFEHRLNQVEFYYETYLGRRADPGGKMFWATAMVNGLSEKELLARFLGSAEFYARSNSDNGTYIARLYVQLLGRPAEVGGYQAWLQALQSGTSREAMALAFLNARETSRKVLDILYSSYLGRRPDPVGEQGWLDALGRNQVQWADVARAFLASDEYFTRLYNFARAGRS